ncbi:MAG: phosphatase PAP2 family protein [Ktedonobacteraceae bacterium]
MVKKKLPVKKQTPEPETPLEQAESGVQQVVEEAKHEVERSRAPWYSASKRAYSLIGFYAVLTILFGLLAWFVHVHPILPVDVAITKEFQENQAPWLSNSMAAISYLGYTPILFTALIVLTAIFFWLVDLRLEAILVVAVSAASELLNGGIKLLVARPRPSARLVDVLSHASGQSFPSGHVMSYVAYFGLLFSLGIILLKRDRWWHYLILIIPALFVILVGPSRIYLGDHWASDVLGAYLIDGILLGISLWIYLKLREKGVLPRKRRRGIQMMKEQDG